MSPSSRETHLDGCGCCESGQTELSVYNRPGQPSLDYRLATHARFLHRMKARLHSQAIPDGANEGATPLEGLTGRSAENDPGVALLDAAATVADVLAFYQERIANEGFLGTATERRSVMEMARAVGYELSPGVAASTYLAFTVVDTETMPDTESVPAGTQVMSIPPKGELPQTFETSEEMTARVGLNALTPQLTSSQGLGEGTTSLYLKGINTRLGPGDLLLVVGEERENDTASDRWDLRVVEEVSEDSESDRTLVTWDTGLGDDAARLPVEDPRVYAFRQTAALFGHNAPDWRVIPLATRQSYDSTLNSADSEDPSTWGSGGEWPNFAIQTLSPAYIDLSAVYPKVLPGGWVVLKDPGCTELYEVVGVGVQSRTDFTLTAQTSRIKLDTDSCLSALSLRDTVVYAQSEELELAEQPVETPLYGPEIILDGLVEDLEVDQPIAITGKEVEEAMIDESYEDVVLFSEDGSETVTKQGGDLLAVDGPPTIGSDGFITWTLTTPEGTTVNSTLTPDQDLYVWQEPGEDADTVGKVAIISHVSDDGERTTIELSGELENLYDRASVTINGNVTKATHGETVADEVLGSGDGAATNQRFKLNKSPITYVSASNASGAEGTLEVRVNDVLWEQVTSLYDLGPQDESYVVRIDNDGASWVTFGDGKSGARLPTNSEKIEATYRSGIGLGGHVDANTLSLLKDRPLGIQAADNPVAASGAEDAEALEDARATSPETVLTLDRIVSLRDFEDAARAYAGIGKAMASDVWLGEAHIVHLTIASTDGSPVETTSELYTNLVETIDGQRDPRFTFRVDDHESLEFDLSTKVKVDSRYVLEDVLEAVASQLESEFAFDTRSLGQPVTAAEVMSVMHQVDGVVAVDLDQLYLSDDPNGPAQTSPEAILPSESGRLENGAFEPAQLLLLSSDGVDLAEMEEE